MLDTARPIETPEGITLDLRIAGPVPRAQAWLIDVLIRAAAYLVLGIGFSFLGRAGMGLFFICMFLVEWFYPVICEVFWSGQTPGKKASGLRVLLDDGSPVTWSASLTRNLLLTVDFLPFLYGFGLLSMLLSRDFKRLGDLAAGTVVVHVRKGGPRVRHFDAEPLPPPCPLSLEDQRAIISFGERAGTFSPQRAEELATLAEPLTGFNGAEGVKKLAGMARALVGR